MIPYQFACVQRGMTVVENDTYDIKATCVVVVKTVIIDSVTGLCICVCYMMEQFLSPIKASMLGSPAAAAPPPSTLS